MRRHQKTLPGNAQWMQNMMAAETVDDGDSSASDGGKGNKSLRTEFASFKFSLLETLAADPAKPSPYCVSVMLAFCKFANFETRQAYCSITTLLILADISSKETAVKCRDWLVRQSYLAKVEGEKGPNGETIYRLQNPRLIDVQDHILAATEKRNEDVARAKREHRKRVMLLSGGTEIGHPETAWVSSNCTDGGRISVPNTVEEPVDYSLSRIDANNSEGSYGMVKGGENPFRPIPKPESIEEAEVMLESICEGRNPTPETLANLKRFLLGGTLTPDWAERLMAAPMQGEAA